MAAAVPRGGGRQQADQCIDGGVARQAVASGLAVAKAHMIGDHPCSVRLGAELTPDTCGWVGAELQEGRDRWQQVGAATVVNDAVQRGFAASCPRVDVCSCLRESTGKVWIKLHGWPAALCRGVSPFA